MCVNFFVVFSDTSIGLNGRVLALVVAHMKDLIHLSPKRRRLVCRCGGKFLVCSSFVSVEPVFASGVRMWLPKWGLISTPRKKWDGFAKQTTKKQNQAEGFGLFLLGTTSGSAEMCLLRAVPL